MRPSILLPILLYFIKIAPLPAQTLRGAVFDKTTGEPLPGAILEIPGLQPPRGATTLANGEFIIPELPRGRFALHVRCLGYADTTLTGLPIENDVVELRIFLEENTTALQGVVISADQSQTPVNRLATVSATPLHPESIRRFSAGRGNVARMAANFAGVGATDDYQNQLVVRGNSPTGLLWRLEGVPIPNPGHLAAYGNSGGAFNAINPNLLGQSDFLTGAFPADFGNTVAGVMDMYYRPGNTERPVYSVQVGAWSGVEALAEGPVWRRQNGTGVIGYRYSFVDLLSGLGMRLGGRYVPQYQDLNWKLEAGRGPHRLAVFGLAGQSHIFVDGAAVDPDEPHHPPTQDSKFNSELLITGLRHQWLPDSATSVRTTVAITANRLAVDGWNHTEQGTREHWMTERDRSGSLRLASVWQRRLGQRWTLRAGGTVQGSRAETALYVRLGRPDFVPARAYDGALWLVESFVQSVFRRPDRLAVHAGLHAQHLPLTRSTALEPRGALQFYFSGNQSLTLAGGLHSQTPALAALFYLAPDGTRPNRRLGFLRSAHGVLAWAKRTPADWRLHAEAYYQHLYDVPVHRRPDGFSLLNSGATFDLEDYRDLVNTGAGRNYGLELTLSKTLRGGFYTLLTASLFDSRYRGSDGVWRNTAFNSRFVGNALLGTEISLRPRLRLTLDTRLGMAGGRWYTPLDLEASRATGTEVYDLRRPLARQYPAFFRWDAKVGLRYHARRAAHHLYLDFTNLTNRRNVHAYRYFRGAADVSTQYQLGFTPDFVYRVDF